MADPVATVEVGTAPDEQALDLGYTVSVDAFSGPLDLLLFLVRKSELDIIDIPVSTIADQFVTLIREWQERGELDLEGAGDFILMAATLLEIKARTIAPPPVEEGETSTDEQDENLDPRADLIGKLLAYRRFKEATGILNRLEADRASRALRQVREEIPEDPDEAAGIDLGELQVSELAKYWYTLLARIGGGGPRTVMKDDLPIEGSIRALSERVEREQHLSLHQLFRAERSLQGRVTMLMATLECTRQRIVQATQHEQYGDVELRFRPPEDRLIVPTVFPPEEPGRKRRRRPPLVTFHAPVVPTADEAEDAAEPEEKHETDEERFLRELNERCDLDGVLSRVADVEKGFQNYWETLHPPSVVPPSVVPIAETPIPIAETPVSPRARVGEALPAVAAEPVASVQSAPAADGVTATDAAVQSVIPAMVEPPVEVAVATVTSAAAQSLPAEGVPLELPSATVAEAPSVTVSVAIPMPPAESGLTTDIAQIPVESATVGESAVIAVTETVAQNDPPAAVQDPSIPLSGAVNPEPVSITGTASPPSTETDLLLAESAVITPWLAVVETSAPPELPVVETTVTDPDPRPAAESVALPATITASPAVVQTTPPPDMPDVEATVPEDAAPVVATEPETPAAAVGLALTAAPLIDVELASTSDVEPARMEEAVPDLEPVAVAVCTAVPTGADTVIRDGSACAQRPAEAAMSAVLELPAVDEAPPEPLPESATETPAEAAQATVTAAAEQPIAAVIETVIENPPLPIAEPEALADELAAAAAANDDVAQTSVVSVVAAELPPAGETVVGAAVTAISAATAPDAVVPVPLPVRAVVPDPVPSARPEAIPSPRPGRGSALLLGLTAGAAITLWWFLRPSPIPVPPAPPIPVDGAILAPAPVASLPQVLATSLPVVRAEPSARLNLLFAGSPDRWLARDPWPVAVPWYACLPQAPVPSSLLAFAGTPVFDGLPVAAFARDGSWAWCAAGAWTPPAFSTVPWDAYLPLPPTSTDLPAFAAEPVFAGLPVSVFAREGAWAWCAAGAWRIPSLSVVPWDAYIPDPAPPDDLTAWAAPADLRGISPGVFLRRTGWAILARR